jgi:hypothetical protein
VRPCLKKKINKTSNEAKTNKAEKHNNTRQPYNIKSKGTNLKMDKGTEDSQTTNKLMKRVSSLVNGKMLIKILMKYKFTPNRMATICVCVCVCVR